MLHAATGNRYADDDDLIRLANQGPVASFSRYKSTTSSGKHLEDITHGHTVSSIYKPKTSAKGSENLSIGFDRDRVTRQRELGDNQKRKYLVR